MTNSANAKHLKAVIHWLRLRREHDSALLAFIGMPTEENAERLLGRDYHSLITAVGDAVCGELDLLADANFPGLTSVDVNPLDDAPAPDGVSLN